MKTFQQTQLQLAAYLRAPNEHQAPMHIEERRLHIYRDLIYNNIEKFLANVFPVTKSVLGNNAWHNLMRDFIKDHNCQTPYFLQMSDEFVQYLLHERSLQSEDPSYLLELAHYEWIELALDVSTEKIPDAGDLPENMDQSRPRVSPLAVCLSYQYPVQKISEAHPQWHPEVTQLLVYRDRLDKVRFSVASPLTARLLFLLQTNDCFLHDHLRTIVSELNHSNVDSLKKQAILLLENLYKISVISHFE